MMRIYSKIGAAYKRQLLLFTSSTCASFLLGFASGFDYEQSSIPQPNFPTGLSMPSPNPRRDRFLKYLKSEFPHQSDFTDHTNTVWPYEQVKEAVYFLKDNAPEILRILNYHMFTPLPRTRIAEEVGFDPSTVKRKLDIAADNVMQRLCHGDFPPKDLFTLRDPKTGDTELSAFPKTFRKNW